METKTVQTELPTRLLVEMESLVNQGWFRDMDELIAGALRRFLESHRPELMEHYIWKDVEWGLHDEDWLGPRSRMRRGTCCSDRADVARQGRWLVFCLS